MVVDSEEILFLGTPICRGIAIGRPYFLKFDEDVFLENTIAPEEVEAEVARYQRAISKAREKIKTIQKKLSKENVLDGVAILDAHIEIMHDPLLTSHIEQQIRKKKKNAEHVIQSIIDEYREKLSSIDDPFFQERFKEIQEISRRIISDLRQNARTSLTDIPHDSVIFAADLTALDTAEATSGCVCGFVTQDGGATSHAAIVAKAKGVPYVSSVDLGALELTKDCCVIVDGRTGTIIMNPGAETLAKYQVLRDQLNLHLQKLKQTGELDAETYDGYKIQLSANIESEAEIDMLHQYSASGVGLFRTESAFLSREDFPSEDEQYAIYSGFVDKMKGLPFVIRTFDFGGDKYLRNQQADQECNPFLGCRAIRFLLREKQVFKTQLKAILRASIHGKVSLMFPMVSSLSELREAKDIFDECKHELVSRGIQVAEYIPIGCMVEVPSAAIIADLLAKECDFLSIGTNDLVQYSLAVDRTNNALRNLYSPTHPSVIRLIRLVVSEANHHGIPVTICGEVAADPRFTPLLLGLGVHELSVASRYIPTVKNAIRNTSIVAASKLAEHALSLTSSAEIEELLTQEYRRNVPEDCFYNC